jgi:hypothetical protein
MHADQNKPFVLMFQITEMKVYMDCAGCETMIRKAIQKLDGTYVALYVTFISNIYIFFSRVCVWETYVLMDYI